MLEQNPDIKIAMIWYVDKESVRISLRTRGDVDVSEIAAKYGGGGHKPASGFEIAVDEINEKFMDVIL